MIHWMNYLLKSYVPNVMFRFCNSRVYDIWTFPYDSENENIVYFGQFLLLLIVQSRRGVWLFVTPQTIAYQASLSTISQSWLKLMSIESVMPSNHLIFCQLQPASPPALSLTQHQGLSQWVSSSHQVTKV